MDSSLQRRSCAALLQAAIKASPSARYDPRGFARTWKENLAPGLPLAEIERDFTADADKEPDGKLRAAHSSAALVVNTFGPWRQDPATFSIAGITDFYSVQFEADRRTQLGGTPPHLDMLAEGGIVAALESKCTEWMKPSAPQFSRSYTKVDLFDGDAAWFEQMRELHKAPDRCRFLDAAQLVKDAFSLLNFYPGHDVRLLYLYWEPRNAAAWPQCRAHRDEANALAAAVEKSSARLIPISCHELWAEWEGKIPAAHMKYLRDRYDLDVPRGLS
jgi:hypothetical protein